MSLQYNNPFSKYISLASAVQLPFRTDSKPFHRRFAGKTGFDTCHWKALQNLFRQSFESSPESRGSQTFGVLLVLFVQAKRINSFPFRGASRFCKPRFSTPQLQLHTATIKIFLRELRGFANLETARCRHCQRTKLQLKTVPLIFNFQLSIFNCFPASIFPVCPEIL